MKNLILAVIEQIYDDMDNKDLTALVELLEYVPEKILRDYLNETKQIELDCSYFNLTSSNNSFTK